MTQILKKILIIIVCVVLVFLIYFIVKPQFDSISGNGIENQISLKILNNDSGTISLQSKSLKINAEIAVSMDQKYKGLGGPRTLSKNSGMLFVYEKPGYYSIWMKDMFFPIDVLWLDKNFRIVDIKENIKPESYPEVFKPNAQALYILEINAGMIAQYEVKKGDVFKLSDIEVDI